MKFFKYLFFLIVLVFVVGSLYIATISIPDQKNIRFDTPLSAELFKLKIQDLSTYTSWFSYPGEATSEMRVSNKEDFENTTLSWQNEKFELINFQNELLTSDSITQRLTLKTWLSSSEFDISWKFKPSDSSSGLMVHLQSETSFWQKTEYVLTGESHIDITEGAIKESLETLERQINEEVSIYDINPIGKIDTGGFYMLHATSAARLNFESILGKSEPIFESVEGFMEEQKLDTFKGRLIVFENLYEDAENIIFSSGIGTENQVAIPDYYEILSKPIRRGTYFKTQLTGDYINLKKLLAISKSTIESRELTVNKFLKPFLEFEVDASETVNPSKWKTNFYIPILEN